MSHPVRMAILEPAALIPLGWSEQFAAAFALLQEAAWEPGRAVAVHRGGTVVRTAGGEVLAGLTRRLRGPGSKDEGRPTVGDWVAINQPAGDSAVIEAVLPRSSALVRTIRTGGRGSRVSPSSRQVLAANMDVAFVVDSFESGPNLRRLERYLTLAWSSDAQPVVVLNKADLVPGGDAAVDEILQAVMAIAPGVVVLTSSALSGDGIAAIEAVIGAGRTAVVVGPSGVGKSTIVNRLLGEVRQATGHVRLDDGRGRHTTTIRQLFVLPGGGLVIDTPGIRSLELAADASAIDLAFSDVAAIAVDCRFADCQHGEEPGCALRAAVREGRLPAERLANALLLEAESRRRDAEEVVAIRDQRRKGRTIVHAVRQHYQRGPRDGR